MYYPGDFFMKHLRHTENLLQLPTTLFYCVLVLCFVYFNAMCQVNQTGDMNNDGLKDGRDALQIMRILNGYESATEELIRQGDIHPYPGTDGNLRGDGLLTEDDAYRILLYAVGLLSEGELNGVFTGSEPIITEFDPMFGYKGDKIYITGKNFVTSDIQKNKVFLGDIPVEVVDASATLLTVVVPDDAKSSFIRLQTPGGEVISPGRFKVIYDAAGQLNISNPDYYVVINEYGVSPIESDGTFTIPVADRDITLSCFTYDDEDTETIYMTLHLPTGGAPTELLQADAVSTAKALVYLNPFLLTRDTDKCEMLMQAMDQTPEVQVLADLITEKYPQGANGLEDTDIRQAWQTAILQVFENMPQKSTIPFSMKKLQAKKNLKRQQQLRAMSQPPALLDEKTFAPKSDTSIVDGKLVMRVYGLDSHFTTAKRSDKSTSLLVELDNGYSALDWYVVMAKLDPVSFPRGLQESFLDLRKRGFDRAGYKLCTTLAADQWTANIDVLYSSVEFVMDSLEDNFFPSDDSLAFEDLEDGLYVVRAYSGALFDHDYHSFDWFAISDMPTGFSDWTQALAINVCMGGVDIWDLLSADSARWARQALRKGVKNVIKEVSKQIELNRERLDSLSYEEAGNIILALLGEFFKSCCYRCSSGACLYCEQSIYP
jgi:hypothetical protein